MQKAHFAQRACKHPGFMQRRIWPTVQICGFSGLPFAMVPCLHQCNLDIKRKLRECRAQKCNPCFGSDSGRLTILKETARSQERLVLRATNTHQTMSRWLLFAKNCESSQTNRLYYLQFLIFVQLKFVWENLKMQVTSA